MGADQAVLTDISAVQDGRADAYQAVVSDRTTMEHNSVADRATRTDSERKSHIRMQYAMVLHIAALPNMDFLIIAAQHRSEPNTGIRLYPHPAD